MLILYVLYDACLLDICIFDRLVVFRDVPKWNKNDIVLRVLIQKPNRGANRHKIYLVKVKDAFSRRAREVGEAGDKMGSFRDFRSKAT